MGELADLLLLDDRLADCLVRLEVGLHAHGVRVDLLAVDDDVDVRDDRLAEEMDVRRQGASHGGGLALCEQRLRVASSAPCERDRQRDDREGDAPHARPRVNMR